MMLNVLVVVMLALQPEVPLPSPDVPANPDRDSAPAETSAPAAVPADAPAAPVHPAWQGVPPEPWRTRSEWSGAVLGGVLGFGVGYYYAGETSRGVTYSIIDGALLMAFVLTEVELNRLVIQHDFRSGLSLAQGERSKGRRESNLYVAAIALAGLETASHLFQAVGGYQAATRTNVLLSGVSISPRAGGATLSLDLPW